VARRLHLFRAGGGRLPPPVLPRQAPLWRTQYPPGDPGAGLKIIHRIVGGSAEAGFVMRGDHTPSSDLWRPKLEAILGSAQVVIPGAMPILLFARSPIVAASVAAVLAAYFALASGQRIGVGRAVEDVHLAGADKPAIRSCPGPRRIHSTGWLDRASDSAGRSRCDGRADRADRHPPPSSQMLPHTLR
jgi:hypothetical protein